MTDLVYIMSPSYSGSTLLTFLLATHPSIATIGELKATAMGDVETYSCSCGRLIRQCPFWQQVTDAFAQRGVPFDVADFGTDLRVLDQPFANRVLRARVRGRPFELARSAAMGLLPACRDNLDRVIEKNRLFIDIVRQIRHAPVFLDSSKDPVRLRYLWQAGHWDTKVIYLVRDGRGTACSFMRHHNIGMRQAAQEWRDAHEECQIMLARLPRASWMQLRYEDLCRQPDAQLDAVLEFLGLEPGQANKDFRAVENHILGNYMRLSSSSEIRLDLRWQTTLGAQEYAEFQEIAGALNRQYGYE